jgi:uncharacterized protein YndB with AHSA1/START domain
MILKILAVAIVLIAAVLLFAASKPNTFTVQRSVVIDAPPEKVFELINDFHNWPKWAPQDKDKEDPSMKRTFSGAASGVGAISDWTGSGNNGAGRMMIIESQPAKKISVQVDWAKPFVATNINDFVLQPVGASTNLVWSMRGPNLYVMKVMSVFVNMDRNMGKHFEAGLANLKQVAEQESK